MEMVFRIGSFPKMAFNFQSRKVEARGEDTVLRETAFYFPPQSGEIQWPRVNQIGSQGFRVAVCHPQPGRTERSRIT